MHLWVDDGNEGADCNNASVNRDTFQQSGILAHFEYGVKQLRAENEDQKWKDGAHLEEEEKTRDHRH